MAENQLIKAAVVIGLRVAEKVLIYMTSLVRAARKGLTGEDGRETHKDFMQIHEKLETISERNKEVLQQIHTNEINEIYGKYEGDIKHQYKAYNNMMENLKLHPKEAYDYMLEFAKIYEDHKMDQSLDVFYRAVMGSTEMGKDILKVYLEKCKREKQKMEERCSHLVDLISIGLMMLIVYYTVTEDNVAQVKAKWDKRLIEIQDKIQEALAQCPEENERCIKKMYDHVQKIIMP